MRAVFLPFLSEKAHKRTLAEIDAALFPGVELDQPAPVVEHAAQDHAEVLRPGWRNDLPVAAPSGGRRA